MSIKAYVREKCLAVIVLLVIWIFVLLFGKAFRVPAPFLVLVLFLTASGTLLVIGREYVRRRRFYNDFLEKLVQLENKYLITEMLMEPEFLEGKLLVDSLYDIDKSMKEAINDLEVSVIEFKEYLELWVHEIKVPLSGLLLMNYNKNTDPDSQRMQLLKMQQYVEQILFYARGDTPQKDYLMKKCRLEAIVNKVLIAQKELLIGSKMQIRKKALDRTVITDAKWLEFILGQIVNNSEKYRKDSGGELVFDSYEEQEKIVLVVEDHGIGIASSDIDRIFEKSFTGKNGRKAAQSTGMGLYICKKLCRKLGHEIWAESEEGSYTRVYIAFGKNAYYDKVM